VFKIVSVNGRLKRTKSNGDIYIADSFNHRIQKWSINASEGVTVAGSTNRIPGSDNTLLHGPSTVWVDEETKVIYIVDSYNNRIQRYQPGASTGETIVGRLGKSFFIIP
jgi:hypothetical protein